MSKNSTVFSWLYSFKCKLSIRYLSIWEPRRIQAKLNKCTKPKSVEERNWRYRALRKYKGLCYELSRCNIFLGNVEHEHESYVMSSAFETNLRVKETANDHGELWTYHTDDGWRDPVRQRENSIDYSQADEPIAHERRVFLRNTFNHCLL